MISPVTTVLIKIFAKGFYRAHGGMFLFLFATIATYCFFITPLNETHLTREEIIRANLIVVLTMLQSPVLILLVLIVWTILSIKSWRYISIQIRQPHNQFLRSSVTSIQVREQIMNWLVVQLVISAPLLGYCAFTLVVGLLFDFYVAPIIISAFVVLLAFAGAWVHVTNVNQRVQHQFNSLAMIDKWKKPISLLFLYHVADQLKTALAVIKVISIAIIVAGSHLLFGLDKEIAGGWIVLGIALAHALLIYESWVFETSYMAFTRNFPVSTLRVYSRNGLAIVCLIIPELIWVWTYFTWDQAGLLSVFFMALMMLLRSLLYSSDGNMKRFLSWTFYLSCGIFFAIMMKLLLVTTTGATIASVIVFNAGYRRQDPKRIQ